MVMISGKSASKPSKRKMLLNNASDVGCLDANKLVQRGLVTSTVRASFSYALLLILLLSRVGPNKR